MGFKPNVQNKRRIPKDFQEVKQKSLPEIEKI